MDYKWNIYQSDLKFNYYDLCDNCGKKKGKMKTKIIKDYFGNIFHIDEECGGDCKTYPKADMLTQIKEMEELNNIKIIYDSCMSVNTRIVNRTAVHVLNNYVSNRALPYLKERL